MPYRFKKEYRDTVISIPVFRLNLSRFNLTDEWVKKILKKFPHYAHNFEFVPDLDVPQEEPIKPKVKDPERDQLVIDEAFNTEEEPVVELDPEAGVTVTKLFEPSIEDMVSTIEGPPVVESEQAEILPPDKEEADVVAEKTTPKKKQAAKKPSSSAKSNPGKRKRN